MDDPFASSTFSLIMAWVCAIPLIFSLVGMALDSIFGKQRDFSVAMSAWVTFCIIVLSPMRYMLLQMVVAATYPWQSWSAFASSFAVAAYIWIGFGILYMAGLGIPFLALMAIAGKETKTRMAMAMAAMPFLCLAGYALFFAILPYMTWSVYWLKDRDVIRATNGPATYFYRFAVRPDIPRIGPQLSDYVIPNENSETELRNHVMSLYVSAEKQARRRMLTTRKRLEYADSILGGGSEPTGTISKDDLGRLIAAYKSALDEARLADVNELNRQHPGLGDAWRDKLIPSIESSIEGWEGPSNWALFKANGLFAEWANWYNTNVAEPSN